MSHEFKHPHLGHLASLLALEGKAEQQKLQSDIQRASLGNAKRVDSALFDLVIRDEVGGLGGHILVTLGKRNQQLTLPWTSLRVGSPILLSETDTQATPLEGESGWRGVVTRVNRESIQVAINDWPESENDNPRYRLDLSSDAIARQRQQAMLEDADKATNNRLAELRDVLLGSEPPRFDEQRDGAGDFEAFDQQLDESQREAVCFALSAADVGIIQGPPGTGKTTAVVELIRQAVSRGQRVLACAPSNLAVDNIFERLLTAPELSGNGRVVRLGHPARVTPALRDNTLEMLVGNHPDMRAIQKLMKEAHALRRQSGKWTRAKPERGARQSMRAESRTMLSDARRMEDQLVERVLDSAQVICATLTGLNPRFLGKRTFELCIIDEAAQSTEPTCWMPLRHSQRIILAGDQCQLPPTIISQKAVAEGFSLSLMERLMQRDRMTISRRLNIQYRMHQAIMSFSSAEFYDNTLMADPQVADHLLSELPDVETNELTSTSVHFIDTAGAGYDEEQEADSESRANPQEADLVCRKVQQLIDANVAAPQIAVISPYSAQVRLLQEQADSESTLNNVEFNSIDGFQGREQEVIIISLVRSNADGAIGFLSETRRMNVALTRARRKLIVIGDSATIGADPFYGRLLDYFDEIGAYHSVWEETP